MLTPAPPLVGPALPSIWKLARPLPGGTQWQSMNSPVAFSQTYQVGWMTSRNGMFAFRTPETALAYRNIYAQGCDILICQPMDAPYPLLLNRVIFSERFSNDEWRQWHAWQIGKWPYMDDALSRRSVDLSVFFEQRFTCDTILCDQLVVLGCVEMPEEVAHGVI